MFCVGGDMELIMKAGFALTGSFCTFSKAIPQISSLKEAGFEVIPIMSEISYSTDTRFGRAADFCNEIETTAGREIIHTIVQAEPIGPQKLLDVLVIAPCTGNTIGKLAGGITDTCVTMAAKAHLRNGRPLVIAVATNDALGASARNIGSLLNTRNVFFVPMYQDDCNKKPTSLVADFDLIVQTVAEALHGRQIEPVLK
jgi:dipicolinate synthase subunit B